MTLKPDPPNPYKIASDRTNRDQPDRVPEWALNLIADAVVCIGTGLLLGLLCWARTGLRGWGFVIGFACGALIGGGGRRMVSALPVVRR